MQFFRRVALAEEFHGEVDDLVSGTAADQFFRVVAVKVRADAHVVDAHEVDDVVDMSHGVQDGWVRLFAQEPVVQAYLHHTPFGGNGSYLVIRQIAGMVA